MKAMRLSFLLIAMIAVNAVSFAAMSLSDIRREARFLTDRMGHELGLSNRQYNDVYEINFDFFFQVNEVLDDMVYGYDDAVDYYYYLLDVRNEDLMYVLRNRQYRRFIDREYFYRPIYMSGNTWGLRIYSHYSDRNYFYFSIPVNYHSYNGAHYRIHFTNSYYARLYTHALYHGAFRLWGGGYDHHHHDGWHSVGRNKYKHVGSRPWSNAKNYENSRSNLKKGLVSVPSRDENNRMVSVDSEENHRTAVPSSVVAGSQSQTSKSRGSSSASANRNTSGASSRNNSGAVSSSRSGSSASVNRGSSSVSSNRSSSSTNRSSSVSTNRNSGSSSNSSVSSGRSSNSNGTSVRSSSSSSSSSRSSSSSSSSSVSSSRSSSNSSSSSASGSSSRSSSSSSRSSSSSSSRR